jgi:hypothetical protein
MMGGLINGSMVRGDLWMLESGGGNLSCYPIATVSEGPGPRVGHASLLVGNAFIVFGGDTKMDDSDVLDDTLYLLNTCESCNSCQRFNVLTSVSFSAVVTSFTPRPSAAWSLRPHIEYTGIQDLHLRRPGRRLLLQ